MRLSCLALCLLVLLTSCSKKTLPVVEDTIDPPTGDTTPVVYDFESEPFWVDEFDYTGAPDSTKWSFEQGGHGWGNNELQYYTNGIMRK